MKDTLTETERNYIKYEVIEKMIPDMNKATLFGTVERAQIMLETSLKQIMKDKNYEARIGFKDGIEKLILMLEVKHRECNEVISYSTPIAFRR